MRRAFTLIELLVVIGIIALLAGLILPALSGSRRQAKATVGYANLRSLGQMLSIYVNENHDVFLSPFRPDWGQSEPYAGIPWTAAPCIGDPTVRWDFVDGSPCRWNHTEGFGMVWYSYLAEYRGGHRGDPEQISPADGDLLANYQDARSDSSFGDATLLPTSFLYSPAFWCKPERFVGCKLQMTPDLLRAAPLASVLYPSAKVDVFERSDFGSSREPLPYNSPRAHTHVSLVDGSADTITIADLNEAAKEGRLQIPPPDCCPPPAPDQPGPLFWATPLGVKGRDLAR
jgi:prepilin-type N-terminal cleavage/methylation domain-containing protein